MDKKQDTSFYASQTFSTSPQGGLPSYGEVISGSPQNTTPPVSQPKAVKLTTKTLDSSLAKSPHELHDFILGQASIPPSISLVVKGTHKEGNNDHTVEDFHFCIDITSDILKRQSQGPHWSDIQVVADGDGQNVYRGGIHRSRRDKKRNLEDGNEPGLMGWCRRFCSDSAKVKSFTLKRKIRGFNFPAVKSTLTSYLRVINYRGKISMKIPMANIESTVYSSNWVNRLRNNRYVAGLCYLSQLWIFTWPTIKLLESRYKVVDSTWHMSLFVKDSQHPSALKRVYACGRDESALAKYWAPVVVQAAWERRKYRRYLSDSDVKAFRQLGMDGLQGIKAWRKRC